MDGMFPARSTAQDARASTAVPLTRGERIAILVIVGAALCANGVVIALRGAADPGSVVVEFALTALFAGYVFSPTLTVVALLAAMAVAVFTGVPLPAFIALSVAVGFTARTGGTVLLAAHVGGVLVAAAATIARLPSGQTDTLIVCLLLATVSGAVGLLLRAARTRVSELDERMRRQQREELAIRGEERQAIADELHDVVSHDLTVIVMHTELMSLDEGAAPTAGPAIRESARKALSDLRRIVDPVQDAATGFASLAIDLEHALSDADADLTDAGCTVETDITLEIGDLTRLVSSTLGRIVRESVTNIIKHSGPTTVWIGLDPERGDAVLTIRNRITPTRTAAPSGGYGSIRMSERAAMLGGSFRSRRVGDDWIVTARLPLGAGAPESSLPAD